MHEDLYFELRKKIVNIVDTFDFKDENPHLMIYSVFGQLFAQNIIEIMKQFPHNRRKEFLNDSLELIRKNLSKYCQ